MKTTTIPSPVRSVRAALFAALAAGVLTSLSFGQVVNPDPEIFDGSKTKTAIEQQQKPETTVDDWEGPNLIIYDSNEQGNNQGGTGTGSGPAGLEVGMPGMSMGIPNPLAGGAGGGQQGSPSLQIPTTQQSGAGAKENADTKGAAQSASRPSDVSIGDPSQRIQTTAQGQAGNVPGAPEGGEEGTKEAGEDSTNVPSSANTNQSGKRGGGVEQGDAMDPDQI